MFTPPPAETGIRSYRKAALALAGGSTLMLASQAAAGGSDAAADVTAAGTAAAADADRPVDGSSDDIVVTGERYRINTLNSRLGDLRDAPQSISVIPREVIEQQAATTLRDVLRNVSGISFAAGEGGGGPAGDNLTLRGFAARNDIFVDGIRDFAQLHARHVQRRAGRGGEGPVLRPDRPRLDRRLHQPLLQAAAGAAPSSAARSASALPEYLRATADLNLGDDVTRPRRRHRLPSQSALPRRRHARPRLSSRRSGSASRPPSPSASAARRGRSVTYMLLEQDNVPDYGIPFVPATTTVPA